MEKEKYVENASMIVELANGMSRLQWRRLNTMMERIYDRLEKTGESPADREGEMLYDISKAINVGN